MCANIQFPTPVTPMNCNFDRRKDTNVTQEHAVYPEVHPPSTIVPTKQCPAFEITSVCRQF